MPARESKAYRPVITRRERLILCLLAEGCENEEIAEELTISEKTVEGTQGNLMRKWNASTVSSVIERALEEGWISAYEVLESRFSKRSTQTY